MATATRKRPRGVNPSDLQTAQAEAALKYGPQRAALSTLIGQVEDQYHADLDASKANAAATIAAVRSARQPTRDIYAEAQRSAANTASDIDASVASRLGAANPVSDVLNASIARERGTQANRVSGERAGALNELQQRMVGAQAGRQLDIRQARSEYGSNLDKIRSQARDLGGDAASYVTARIGALRSERAKLGAQTGKVITSGAFAGMTDAEVRALSPGERQSQIDTYNANRGGGGKKGKSDRRTAEQRRSLSDTFQKALRYAHDYTDRATAADELLRGASPVKTKAGETIPGVPSFPQLALSLALDMRFDGKVSKANAAKLHDLGYKVSDVTGALSSEDWKRKHGRQQELSSTYGWGQ